MALREITCEDCNTTFVVERGQSARAGRWPRFCPTCRENRDRASNRRKQYRWREANPEKWKAARDRAWAKRSIDPEFRRRKRQAETLRNYGLTPESFAALLMAQGRACAICGIAPPEQDDSKPLPRGMASTRLHVDHCHTTGRVRGLLCGNCNTMIGLAGENPTVLMAAVEYLQKG